MNETRHYGIKVDNADCTKVGVVEKKVIKLRIVMSNAERKLALLKESEKKFGVRLSCSYELDLLLDRRCSALEVVLDCFLE